MKKKLTLALVFVMCMSLISASVYAEDAQQKLNNVNNQISNVKKQLREGKKQEKALSAEIQKLESKINSSQAKVNAISGDIGATQAKINVATAELTRLQTEMTAQNANLNARLRSMYKNGNIGFVDVLLGSNGIQELMTNLDRVKLVYENDKKVMDDLKAQNQVVADSKQKLLALQQSLVAKQNEAKHVTAELNADKKEVAGKKAEVANNNQLLEAQEKAFLAEANRLSSEIRALQSQGTSYSGGSMAWPAPGNYKITSPYGYRTHPVTGAKGVLHTGVDIAARTGSPIVAANAGTVIKAGMQGSYGNAVFIDHGGKIITVYAHNSRLLVSVGDVVARGQQIAEAGSTGRSTGPHLHFEVRVDGKHTDPRAGWI